MLVGRAKVWGGCCQPKLSRAAFQTLRSILEAWVRARRAHERHTRRRVELTPARLMSGLSVSTR